MLDRNSLDTRIDYSEIWRIVENLPWCALISSGRAGSDAFQSQLDSHPDIFVFNGQVDIHKFWNSESHAVEYGVEGVGEYDVGDIVDEFIGRHIQLLKSRYDSHENKHRLLRRNRSGARDLRVPLPRVYSERCSHQRRAANRRHQPHKSAALGFQLPGGLRPPRTERCRAP